mmetsp:Transcript_2700/g.11997  ORF Transcript_2700/g.11997 Transcript_2700/m.11997 type:complete len:114 (-) Transcript_2700:218-559(-)
MKLDIADWCTPNRKKPFVGATYLPIDRFSFALKDISEKWNSMGDKLEEEGERIVTALRQLVAQPRGGLAETLDKDFLTLGEPPVLGKDTEALFGAAPETRLNVDPIDYGVSRS